MSKTEEEDEGGEKRAVNGEKLSFKQAF